MKIFKILFLGIVLVLFNLAYLAAQTLPDTIEVKPAGAEPGGALKISVDVKFHSANAGGLVLVALGLPSGLITTSEGVDLTDGGTAPTDPGTWWFEWTEGYGKVLKTNAGLASEVLLNTEDGSLSVTLLGANIDQLEQFAEVFGYDPSVGTVVNIYINVPADFAEGTYALELAEGGFVIGSFSPPGLLDGVPVATANPIVIAEIPDDNTLRLDASLVALSGGTLSVPVHIANKDTVGSGSFKLTYPSSSLTFSSVTGGTRAGGMNFGSGVALAGLELSAVGDQVATISFTGGEIPTGGLGELCTVELTVASLGAGTTGSVVLSDVALKDKLDNALAVAVSPQATAELSFAFADTLAIDVQAGNEIATIIDGQLLLPIRLKNSVPVQSIRFYVTEGPVDKIGVLALADPPVMTLDPTVNWVVTAVDNDNNVQVAAYAATAADEIAAGDQVILNVVYDISLTEVPAVGDPGVDIDFGLSGIEVVDENSAFVGIETLGGTATLDWRVPTGGEGVGPGATLPKAFALTQNHPNPFNPSTTINYQIPEDAGSVSFALSVYDIRGRMVKTLDKGMKGAGFYSAFWDGTDSEGRQVSSGVYFYRFTSSKYSATRKMILLK